MTATAKFQLALSLAAAALLLSDPLRAQEGGVPRPVGEQKLTGFFDVQNRWVQDIGGNQDVYRSIVNLGEGPRLFSGQVQYRDASGKYLDRLEATASSWGGDPHNTARIEAELANVYVWRFNYRNVNYFNSLPSFANPLLAEGSLLSQRALDITRRQVESEVEFRPGSLISPFFSFYNAQGFGRGVTTFVTDGNEFPVTNALDDDINSFRGGVRVNLSKYNFTLEQGRTSFEDEQEIFFRDGANRGNRRTTLFGREILLDNLTQAYNAEGSGVFNRAVVQGRPWNQIHFAGQFLYSQPDVEVSYDHEAEGSFFSLMGIAPFTSEFEQAFGDAQRPHTSGSWNTEFRPAGRLRIVQSWFTDRFHVAAGSLMTRTLNTTPETIEETRASDRLVLNYSQHQVDAMFDVNSHVTLRGGHRYVWGDAQVRPATLQFTESPRNAGEVRRNVGLAGATFRAGSKLSVTADFEASPGDEVFFRTGLMDYRQLKVRARYRLASTLTVSGLYSILDNENPAPDVSFDFRSQRTSIGLFWAPGSGRRVTLLADYTRATVRSDIPIISLPFFGSQLARYRDNGHHGSAFADVRVHRDVRLHLGGSLSITAGSRPTRYYRPQARLAAPIAEKVSWTAEWGWFGFNERLFSDENFRTHIFSTGIRFQL